MKRAMNLTLIRHIKTIAPEGMCYGQADLMLPVGFEKTHAKIASELKTKKFDAIFSSPLQRCASLAKAIAADNNSILFDDRLKELSFGEWELKMWIDIENLPEAKLFFDDYMNVPPPNGECFGQLIARIESFFKDLQENYQNNNVLIVTHGGPIRVFHSLINHSSPENSFNLKMDYGECFTFAIAQMK